ncbi:OmpP1/FadL family transporter [Seleniivibrio woodruffii]|uniref:OmpP1/FadL family transporter n=1 Tax=Seleniivibrio woodruffii TaxID=1078050 RepID=UPI0026EF051C|nr:outer membrane protein transport protein [Seleniivibrio woodruffii]
MKKILLFSALLLSSAFSAFAGHVDTYGIGSKATSMGGAVVAGIDDPFAVYYNPAAMSNIQQPMLSVGTHLVDPHLTIKQYRVNTSGALADDSFGADGIKDEADLLIVPHMGYVHPITDKLTFGVAFYVPYGLDLKWNADPNENPAAYNTYHSWYMREVVTPSLSYKVNDKLSIGAGISIGKAKAGNERKRYVPEKMKNSTYMAGVAQANGVPSAQAPAVGAALAAAYTELDGADIDMEYEDNFNWSYNLGVLYKFTDKLTGGITYRSYSNIDLEGDAEVTPEMAYWKNENLGSDTAVDTPDSIQFGLEYKVTPKFKVEADIVRTFWSRIGSYTVYMDDYLLQSELDPTFIPGANEEYFERNWKDTWQYRVGAEYLLNDKVALRAGYYYDPTVVPEDTFDVLWPDSDKHVFSGGVGLNFGKVTVDTVVQYILISEVTIDSGSSHNLDDSYSRPGLHDADVSAVAGGHIWSFGVTASYKF